MALQESGEMYLESILLLTQKNGQVRSIDISEHMGYSKPSVSRAMGLLKKGGFITVEHDGQIKLTESGHARAEEILIRHKVLTDLLIRLGVDREIAAADACRMEHVISNETFEAMKAHLQRYGRS